MKKVLFVLLVVLVLSSGPVWAKDGFYMGMDLGVAVAPEMDVQTGGIDDWATEASAIPGTRCDKTINPDSVQVPQGACGSAPNPWGPMDESFDGGSGILAGLSVGYRLGNFRAEGEYFYRNTNFESTDVPSQGDWRPTQATGYEHVQDAVDDVLSHNFFANLYYDYHSDSKFTPYVGIGIGLAKVSVAYRTLWQRSTNLNNVGVFATTGPEGAAGEALNQKLVGSLTYDQAKMSDTLFGYQALAGVDYQVSEPLTIGLKFRYADFGEFEAESAYTKLRGHESVAGNPPVPVTYYIRTDDIQFWGVSLNMKYQF
jgi:opacity protein-like surface antigen